MVLVFFGSNHFFIGKVLGGRLVVDGSAFCVGDSARDSVHSVRPVPIQSNPIYDHPTTAHPVPYQIPSIILVKSFSLTGLVRNMSHPLPKASL